MDKTQRFSRKDPHLLKPQTRVAPKARAEAPGASERLERRFAHCQRLPQVPRVHVTKAGGLPKPGWTKPGLPQEESPLKICVSPGFLKLIERSTWRQCSDGS